MGAKAKNDLAPLVRTAFVNAIGLMENDSGKTFSEMMKDCIESDGLLAVLDRLAKYTVREQHVSGNLNHDHTHRVEVIQEESRRILDSFAEITTDISAEILVQDQPVLPDTGSIQPN